MANLRSIVMSILTLILAIRMGYRLKNQATSYLGGKSTICEDDILNKNYFIENNYLHNNYQSNNSTQFSFLNSKCYFSDNYLEAFNKFKELSSQLNNNINDDNISEYFEMNVYENLSTQVEIIRGNNKKYLIHISGTHGIEAYAGSSIQLAILQYLKANNFYTSSSSRDELPTIVLVHANNPYGFHNNRRVNEDNVDLNRNFLTEKEFKFVTKRDPNFPSYVDFDSFLNPTRLNRPFPLPFLNEIYSYLTAGYVVLKYGMVNLKRAMVAGNYFKSDGYGYGGIEQTQSTKNLIDLLENKLKLTGLAEKAVFIDVHTGLGPSGVDTLMYQASDYEKNPLTDKEMEKIFPIEVNEKVSTKVIGPIKAGSLGSKLNLDGEGNEIKSTSSHTRIVDKYDADSGYELTVGTTDAYCANDLFKHLNGADKICICEEFGTVAPVFVGVVS